MEITLNVDGSFCPLAENFIEALDLYTMPIRPPVLIQRCHLNHPRVALMALREGRLTSMLDAEQAGTSIEEFEEVGKGNSIWRKAKQMHFICDAKSRIAGKG